MLLGKRTLKTGLAILAAVLICNLIGQTDYFILVFTALASVGTTMQNSYTSALSSVAQNIFGAIIAMILVYSTLPLYFTLPLAIMILIMVNNAFTHIDDISTSMAIIILTLTDPKLQPEMLIMTRMRDILIGSAIGLIINMVIFPPKITDRIKSSFSSLSKETDVLLEKIFVFGLNEELESYRQKIWHLSQDISGINSKNFFFGEYTKDQVEGCRKLIYLYDKAAIYIESLSIDNNAKASSANQEKVISVLGRLSVTEGTIVEDSKDGEDRIIREYIMDRLISVIREIRKLETDLGIKTHSDDEKIFSK